MAGHNVSGISNEKRDDSLYARIEPDSIFSYDLTGDVRSIESVSQAIEVIQPDIVVHLAAQSLVRESYRDPVFTYETNVLGSINVLDAVSNSRNPAHTLMITTDKVYENTNQRNQFVESDKLGGHDPYSSSKAIADVLIQSWQRTHPELSIGIARAGNVIGGGDTSKERLMPDLLKSVSAGENIVLRNPDAVRPWQHVLDCLAGYLHLVQFMQSESRNVGAWNFGPKSSEVRTVNDVAKAVYDLWGKDFKWHQATSDSFKEAEFLLLDSSKARAKLQWSDKLDFERAILFTVRWQQRVNSGMSPRKATEMDIEEFLSLPKLVQ
jgi:CDP-glucose 4,6-dehydratase